MGDSRAQRVEVPRAHAIEDLVPRGHRTTERYGHKDIGGSFCREDGPVGPTAGPSRTASSRSPA
jgi:hypothetical protein